MTEKERLAEQERIDGVKKEADQLRQDIAKLEEQTSPEDKTSPAYQQHLQDGKNRLAALDQDIATTSPKLLVPSNAETPSPSAQSSEPPKASSIIAAVPPPEPNANAGKAPDLEPDPDNEGGFRIKKTPTAAVPSAALPIKGSDETAAPSAETGPNKDKKPTPPLKPTPTGPAPLSGPPPAPAGMIQ